MSESDSNPINEAIAEAISEHETILFMKGTPDAPACGFSARTVAMLQSLQAPFAAVDILPDPRIRQELSAISGWPTIPQLFYKGELIGGCDIVTEMYESGELADALGLEANEDTPTPAEPVASEPYPEGHTQRAHGRQPAGFTPIENRLS
jgi:monothiol glutaredoxin